MATISTLAVNLIARTSAFERGMKRGRTATMKFRETIGKAVSTVARFAKGLALVGFGAMTVMIKKSLQTLDVVAKLSRRINITTEALLGLRHAAELAGVSTQALDKSLEIFVRRMGEVKSGSGEATRGLEALGLSAEQMIAATPDQAMLIIADRIQELGTQAEKSAAAYFLFGRSGAQLLNLFEQGSKGIKKATDEARKLGLTLEGFDLTKVEDANDAMTKFKSAISAVFLELTVNISPALKTLADLMTKNRDRILQTAKNAVIFSVKLLASIAAIKAVIGIVRVLISTLSLLISKQVVVQALAGPAGWALLATSIGVATVAIIGINKAIDKTIDGLKNLGLEKSIKGPLEEIKKLESGIFSLSVRIRNLKEAGSNIPVLEKEIALHKKRLKVLTEATGILDRLDKAIASAPRFFKIGFDQSGLDKAIAARKELINFIEQETKTVAELEKSIVSMSKALEREKAAASNAFLIPVLEKALAKRQERLNALILENKTIKELTSSVAFLRKEIEKEKAFDPASTRPFIQKIIIADLNRTLKLRQDQLNMLIKEKKIQDGLAAKEKERLRIQQQRLTNQLTLMARVKAEAQNIITNVFDKLSDLSKTKDDGFGGAGKFQQIRSAFIDVAALNPSVTPVTELQKLNNKTDDTNRLLEELNRNSMGVHQT